MTEHDYIEFTQNTERQMREILRNEYGTRQYRITADNNVHVCGPFPNAIGEGWYLKGDFHTVARDYGLVR